MTDTFVWMYHPTLGNRQVRVSLGSVDDHAARGWLLVDPGVTPPAPTTPYTTVAQVASQLSSGTGPIGVAGRAAFGSLAFDPDGQPVLVMGA